MATVREPRPTSTSTTQRRTAAGSTTARGTTSTTTSTTPATADAVDGFDPALATNAADQRLRAGQVQSGTTRTQPPALLDDWKRATLEAVAGERARDELAPELRRALADASAQKGGDLDEDELDELTDAFFDRNRARYDDLTAAHLRDVSKTPAHAERTVQTALLDHRGAIQGKRDPFTPIAQRDPQARAKEIVLWENPRAMVIVDLFSPRPKALVVPKAPAMFPVELDKRALDELALIAAHVSDAFMAVASPSGGGEPAGIWINPPQHLMVKQLHVHVLPQLVPGGGQRFSPVGEPLIRAAQRDPGIMRQARAYFAQVGAALEKTLGPSS